MALPLARSPVPGPQDLVGTYRTFGSYGPTYEVTRVLREIDEGDTVLLLTVLETGEQVEALYSHIVQDPGAR
jgi:hypothetical protein